MCLFIYLFIHGMIYLNILLFSFVVYLLHYLFICLFTKLCAHLLVYLFIQFI